MEDKKDKPNLKQQFNQAFSYLGPQLMAQIFMGTEAATITQSTLDKMRQAEASEDQAIEQRKLAQAKESREQAKEERAISKEARAEAREQRMAAKDIAQEERAQRAESRAGTQLDIQLGNLKARAEELEQQKKRTTNLQEERKIKRDQFDLNQYSKQLELFQKNSQFKDARDKLDGLKSIKDAVTLGKKIPGMSLSLVARILSSEKGVLTEQDVTRAKVNPSILNNLKSDYYRTFKGEINPDDKKEILKIVELISKKTKDRTVDKINAYAKNREAIIPKKYKGVFKESLLTDFQPYFSDETVPEGEALTAEEEQELRELEELERQGKIK